ncbi:MAG: N-6 DNA methylase [Myxococcota bacterium]
MTIAPLEASEVAASSVAHLLRTYTNADFSCALRLAQAAAARARGLRYDPCALEELGAAVCDERTLDAPWWAEAHALGWVHQHFFAPERDASFAAHTKRDAKHSSIVRPTQLYTPRWLADALARQALMRASSRPTVLDPAMGAGQMLLAALDVLGEAHPTPGARALAESLSGRDLDPAVVDVARSCVAMRLAELEGEDWVEDDTWEVLCERLVVGDGLEEQPGADVVLSNPPYMGARAMPRELLARLEAAFAPFHLDLCVAFMRQCAQLAAHSVGLLVQQSVWYLSRFERARRMFLEDAPLEVFLHLGPHGFATLTGEKAAVVASVHRIGAPSSADPVFVDARGARSPKDKRALIASWFHGARAHETRTDTASLLALPGAPMAYDLPVVMRGLFDGVKTLGEVADVPGAQNKTGANSRYVRAWDDVKRDGLHPSPMLGVYGAQPGRWVFYSKGGRYAPWWGNWTSVVDWSEEARHFYADNRTSNLLAEARWFREGLCYTDFAGQRFNARWMPAGCVFDMTGPAIFVDGDEEETLLALLGILNSTPARALLNALNPSIHYQVRDVRRLPMPAWDDAVVEELAPFARAVRDGYRTLHRCVPGDPLFDQVLDGSGTEELLESVHGAWEELDKRVCQLYGWRGARVTIRGAHHVERRLATRRLRLSARDEGPRAPT